MFVEKLNVSDVAKFFNENYDKTNVKFSGLSKKDNYFEVKNIYSNLDYFSNCEIHDFDIRTVNNKEYKSFKNLSALWQKYMTKTFGNEYVTCLENQRLKNIESNFCK